MNNWILLAGLIIIEFTIIAVGIIVCRKIEEHFGEVLPVYKEMCDCYERIMKNIEGKFSSLHKIFEAQKNLTEQELKAYNLMNEHIQNLGEMHKELLDCWRSIEERYSETYEQFEQIDKANTDIYAKTIEIYDFVKPITLDGFDDDDIYWEPLSEEESEEDASDEHD